MLSTRCKCVRPSDDEVHLQSLKRLHSLILINKRQRINLGPGEGIALDWFKEPGTWHLHHSPLVLGCCFSLFLLSLLTILLCFLCARVPFAEVQSII